MFLKLKGMDVGILFMALTDKLQ